MKVNRLIVILLILTVSLIHEPGWGQMKNMSALVDIPLDPFEYLQDLKAIDLNNDGFDELIILTGNANQIYNYRWSGTDFQQIWSSNVWYSNNVNGMQAADFDNDNKTDLLISWSGYSSLNLSWYKNFGDLFIYESDLIDKCPHELFCAYDFNGDSLLDIAIGNAYGNSDYSINLYKQNPDNHTVQFVNSIPEATVGNNMVKGINLDNDPAMDILGTEIYTGKIYTFLNQGDFTFSQSFEYQLSGLCHCIEVADFNGDGLDDFIAGEYFSKLHFFKNDNGGSFNLEYSGTADERWNEAEVTDINHDGLPDIIAHEYNGGIFLYKNLGGFSFDELYLPALDTISYHMIPGDFDGNGEIDLAYGRNPVHVVFDVANSFIPVSIREANEQKKRISVSQNYPNPFKDKTTISYDIFDAESAQLRVYDLNGSLVLTYGVNVSNSKLDISGESLNPGIYYYILVTNYSMTEAKKMLKR